MANPLSHGIVAARFANSDALVCSDRQDWFESCMRAITAHPDGERMFAPEMMGSNDDGFWPAPQDWRASLRPYVVENSVLKVPVMGVLLNRFGYQLGRYATGYTYIQRAVERGLEDSAVKGIAFVCDSPGGEVAGCFELCDKLFGYRNQKPMRAFAADAAYSAAYAIASCASKISMTRSGGVGSVGVVTMHVDQSKMLDDFGLKITFIFAGKHKVDGNPYEKLPDNVKARIQKRVDKTYAVFTSTVARNRRMDEKEVRATEALTYGADEALDVGFADKVEVFEEAIAEYSAEVCQPAQEGPQAMADNQNADTVTQAAHTTAVAAARDEGQRAGVTAERTRISAIMALPESANRQAAALEIATTTDMSVDQAKGLLAKLPENKPEAATPAAGAGAGVPKAMFDAAMQGSGNPNVGAGNTGGDDDGDNDSPDKASARILGNYNAARGVKRNGDARQ